MILFVFNANVGDLRDLTLNKLRVKHYGLFDVCWANCWISTSYSTTILFLMY